MAKQTFTTGQVLTAAQMTSLQQTAMGGGSAIAKTASYVLVAADAGTVVQMNAAGATTITVNTALFAAGDTIQIQNIGAGVCTVTAGTATISTAGSLALPQFEGGDLYFNSASAALFFDIVQGAGMTNPLTTTGDTIFSSSGTTPARLGIGSTNQALGVTGGIPAWQASSKSTLTTTGDTIYASGANTPARLGIGSTGQVLTVAAGVPSWATAAAGGGMTLIATTSLSGTSVTVSSIPSTYKHLMIVFQKVYYNSNDYPIQFRFNSDTGSNYNSAGVQSYNSTVNYVQANAVNFEALCKTRNAANNNLNMFATFNIYDYTATTGKGFDFSSFWADSGGTRGYVAYYGNYYSTSAISSITAIAAGQSFSGGTMYTYGVS